MQNVIELADILLIKLVKHGFSNTKIKVSMHFIEECNETCFMN